MATQQISSSISSQQQQQEGGQRQKKFCDLCWRKDGACGMILQTCCKCNVSVHNECYGIDGDAEFKKKKSNWLCLACASVGMTIKVRERDPITNERITFTISERPTECVLCSVDDKADWYHAMHPLYDSSGKYGRQIVVPSDPKTNRPTRLAWAHTLCCSCVNTAFGTSGSIYGCTQDGQYNKADGTISDSDDDDDDDESTNSYLTEVIPHNDLSIHHFVFDGPNPYIYDNNKYSNSKLHAKNRETWHDQVIGNFQKLKCVICSSTDVGTLRVPGKLF
jgi:hypothetical protein